MNVFSNILLAATSMLYLWVLSDARCACLGPKTIANEVFPHVHNGECSLSRRHAGRQICPSRTKISFDPKRTPRYLTEKKCCHQKCPAGEGYRCEEYRVPIVVTYHDVDAQEREVTRHETLHVSVTCVCVAPRLLPEPPKK